MEQPPPLDFDSFFRAQYAPLVGALSVAVGVDIASDAVQEAFMQANLHWRRVGRLDRPGAWVRRVALRRLTDHHRRTGRSHNLLQRIGPAPAAEQRHADTDLAGAVDGLPTRQRLAVCLHYLLDLSVGDVALELGISEGTVKSTLHDARRSLRNALEVIDDGC